MSKIINNLNEFLAWRGFGEDEARYWARCFYKYVDCGPWVVFLMQERDKYLKEHPPQVARFEKSLDRAILQNANDLQPDFVQFLGYDDQGLSKKERTWDVYNELVDKFIADEAKQKRTGRELEIVERSDRHLVVQLPGYTEPIDAVHKEIYYEDVDRPVKEPKERDCGCRLKDGGPWPGDEQSTFYIEGDPEPDCLACHGSGRVTRYYPTGEKNTVNPELCVGIKFGSIVEGSDVCFGPVEHIFPFKAEDFDRDVEEMEQFTSYFWERDNSQWYMVCVDEGSGNDYYLHNTWGDIQWDSKKPYKQLRERVEKFIEEHWEDIPSKGYWGGDLKNWEPIKIPGTRATIHEYVNDMDY